MMKRYTVSYGHPGAVRVFETDDMLHLRDFLVGVRSARLPLIEVTREGAPVNASALIGSSPKLTMATAARPSRPRGA